MIGRKSVVGLALLCALAISALSVSSASAATTPATAYTCSKEASVKDKFGAHCLSEGTPKEWGHIEIAPNKPTAITATNEKTAAGTTAAAGSILAGTLSGVITELQCSGLHGEGELENKEVENALKEKEMVAHGHGVIEYTGCTVTKPAGKGCVVSGGTVTTNELTAISEGPGKLNFKPASGTTFATITIASCSVTALNNPFPVTGTVQGTVNGATTTTTESGVTTQNTLKFGGNKAGLEGALTISMKEGNAIVLT